MIIGVPKEIMHGELRVSAIPETVAKFIEAGAEVLVEKSGGGGSLPRFRVCGCRAKSSTTWRSFTKKRM